MHVSSGRTPLARKRRALTVIRVAGAAALIAAMVLLWNDPPALGVVAGAVSLLVVVGFYLVEVRYAHALERALARSVEWGEAWSSRTIPAG